MAKNRLRLFRRSQAESSQSAEPSDDDFLIDTPDSDRSRAQPHNTEKAKRAASFNRLAVIFLVLSAAVLVCYLLIFLIPSIPLNPLPPYSLAIATVAPTQTPLPTATPTHTPTATRTPTSTPRPTRTSTPTDTPEPTSVLTGTQRPRTPTTAPTVTPTAGPTLSPLNYTAEVSYQFAQLYGVNWAGMAGLVFGLDSKHQPGLTINAWGDPPLGQNGDLAVTGTFSQYGPSGWEITLGDRPVSGTWNVQLVDVNGFALSPVMVVEFKGDPRANLAYIIFRQNH